MPININDVEFEDLKKLCRRLLCLCSKLSEKPHYITNPIRIVLDHANIINKLNLFDEASITSEMSILLSKRTYNHLPKDDAIFIKHEQDGMKRKAVAQLYGVDQLTVIRRYSKIRKKGGV